MRSRSATPPAAIQAVLQRDVLDVEWTIATPEHGQQQECYLARCQGQSVFLKFASAPAVIIRRLSDLGVTPRLLASGDLDGRSYVIQEYVQGTHPSGWRWFGQHLPLLATSTHRYQTDTVLRRFLVAHVPTSDYHAHLETDFAELERRLSELSLDRHLAADLTAALAELRRQAARLQPVDLVPVHGDPHGLNIILAQEQLFLVDWDDICLSDPVRDCAPWLCWYVEQARWSTFFAHYGCELDQTLLDRLFWWAARASFANALWHLSRQYSYEVFAHDCWDALRQKMVPHQVFAGT